MTKINIDNFYGGLSLIDPSNLEDNQFEILKNFYYDRDKRVITRRGIKTFGNNIGSSPITSYFFYQRDDTGVRMALCTSGTGLYKYNEGTLVWDSVTTGLTEFEADGTTRTRWSFAVYKNVVYMCNGVDGYASYDGTTYTYLGTSSVGTATFDNTTDIVTVTGHGLTENDNFKPIGGTLPTGLSERWYYVKYIDANTFKLSLTPSGTTVNFTTNGSGTTTGYTSSQPRVRYLKYMGDRVFGAGDDANPTTLYYTGALPSNANSLNTNTLVVGGDELGKINGILDLGNLILVFKNKKIYSINVGSNTAEAIDTQNGGYSHRAIRNVENSIFYYNDGGVETLKARSGLSGASGLASEPLSNDLRSLINKITPYSYNYSAGYYIPTIANYYFSFDIAGDRVAESTLVRSSITGGWSEYTYPSINDYGYYIDSDGEYHYLIASAGGGQIYEIETGFQDNGIGIKTELQTKKWDLKDSTQWKIYESVDIIGIKNVGSEINIEILSEGDIITTAILDDTFINKTDVTATIGTLPIGLKGIGGGEGSGEDIDLYPYMIRIPMYSGGPNIQVRMYSESNPNIWSLDKINISFQKETMTIFPNINIA